MFYYIIKRIMAGMISLFTLITITFFLMHSVPGGPFSPAEERNMPQVIIERLEEKYGLNKPTHEQYLNYLKGVVNGDLGISFKQEGVSVNEMIKRGFPVSAKVGIIGVIFSILVGVPLGIISAVKRGKWEDWVATIIATIGIAIPNFVVAVLLLFFFSIKLRWFPVYGLNSVKSYVLPVIGLTVGPISYIARLMRSSMLEVMRQDYIRTARAKGVHEFFVIMKHALRNSMIPVVTYIVPLVAALLTGSFVIERIFAIPGIGREFVTGISDRDYSIIIGLTIFFGTIIIVTNIIVDLIYVIIDPRIKIEE